MQGEARKSDPNRWRVLAAELPLMALLCSCSAYVFVVALDLRQSYWTVLGNSAILAAACSAARYSRRTTLLTGLGMAVLAAVFTAALLLPPGDDGAAASFRRSVSSFYGWASSYLLGRRMERPEYASLLATAFNALITLASCLTAARRARPAIVLLPGLAVFVSLFAIGHDVHLPSLFGFVLTAALYVYYSRYRNSVPDDASLGKAPSLFLLSAIPAAGLVLCAAILLSGALPIDPQWMKELRERQKQRSGVDIIVSDKTDIGTTELGGVPLLDDTVLMEVTSPVGGVYLRGGSKDTYTGHSWLQSDTAQSLFIMNDCSLSDTLETVDALDLRQIPIGSLYTMQRLSVRYRGIATNILYLPLKTAGVAGLDDRPAAGLIGQDTVMLDAMAPPTLAYTVEFYDPDMASPAFTDSAGQCHRGLYEENRYFLSGSTTALPNAAAKIYGTCLRLPESLPKRVTDLALEISGGEQSDYAKAKAIERYLSSNYTYTLTPGRSDRAADFVDQFLFETREGYCTYFATAMAVLLRCAGIPSRYVEGYVLPPAEAGSNTYLVTKRQGHAWVEAYFEGLGWISFEPTSSYAGGARPSFTPEPSRQVVPTEPPERTDPPSPDPSNEVSAAARRVNLLFPACLTALALLLSAFYAVPYAAGRRMLKANPREAAIILFRQCLDVLAALGVLQKNGESLSHLAQRAEKAAGLHPGGIAKAVEIFQVARFSAHDVTTADKKQLLAARNDLLRASAKKIGVIRYLYFRWIWG